MLMVEVVGRQDNKVSVYEDYLLSPHKNLS